MPARPEGRRGWQKSDFEFKAASVCEEQMDTGDEQPGVVRGKEREPGVDTGGGAGEGCRLIVSSRYDSGREGRTGGRLTLPQVQCYHVRTLLAPLPVNVGGAALGVHARVPAGTGATCV